MMAINHVIFHSFVFMITWVCSGVMFAYSIESNQEFWALIFAIPVFTWLRFSNSSNLIQQCILGSVIFWVIALRWMVEDEVTPARFILFAMSVLIGTAHILISCFVYLRCESCFKRLFYTTVIWSGMEEIRNYISIGCPWYFISYAMADAREFIQIADTIGAAGLSGIILFFNLVLIEITRAMVKKSLIHTLKLIVYTALLVAVTLAYGNWRLRCASCYPYSTPIKIALVQTNLTQERLRKTPGRQIASEWRSLTERASLLNPDLTITPECMFPTPTWTAEFCNFPTRKVPQDWHIINRDGSTEESICNELIQNFLFPHAEPIIVGIKTREADKSGKLLNTASVLDKHNRIRFSYAKRACIPFYESDSFGLNRFAQENASITPGNWDNFQFLDLKCRRSESSDVHVLAGILVCYEDVLPILYHKYWHKAKKTKTQSFFVAIGNESLSLRTRRIHLNNVIFRSVETRSSILRAVNCGISAHIDPFGYVQAIIPPCGVQGDEGDIALSEVRLVNLLAVYPVLRVYLMGFYLVVGCVFVRGCHFF